MLQARFRAWGHDIAASLDPRWTGPRKAGSRSSELALVVYLKDLGTATAP